MASIAEWCDVSKQRVHQWCADHDIKPVEARAERVRAILIREEMKLKKARQL